MDLYRQVLTLLTNKAAFGILPKMQRMVMCLSIVTKYLSIRILLKHVLKMTQSLEALPIIAVMTVIFC